MPEDISVIKCKLAILARQKDKREVAIGQDEPTKWWFGSVKNPKNGRPFTPAGAWEFIAEQLEKKQTNLKEVVLKKPIGKIAYEFLVRTDEGNIYIKVRLSGEKIIGRSFHYSE